MVIRTQGVARMTEKRLIVDDDYAWIDTFTNTVIEIEDALDLVNKLWKENEKLKSENKRLTDKLNETALELVDGVISQGNATEISEMSYKEFLDYRAKNGKPMELQL